ncbi:MAG: DUF3990 domain-containing protein [Oscillospiraceae bacterium]|nr:DUF3990 domain-containing protein [Oscillospiraceae bacterium]
MKMKDGMLLFHGSYTAVKTIDLTMCMEGKDFGSGFYLTSSEVQAKGFIRTSVLKAKRIGYISLDQNYGFVSSFRYNEDGLKIFEFENADREWLWFIAQNRRPYLAERLTGRVNPEAFQADVVLGKVANDKTNPTITAYLNGLYGDILSERAVSFAIEELLPNQLEDQFCFRTKKAVACLNFQEARKYVI